MKKKLVTLFAFVTTALVLVACGGVVVETPPQPKEVTAVEFLDVDNPLATFNGNRGVIATVPGTLSGDMVVFEATGSKVNRIVVRDSNMDVIAGSNSPHFFVGPNAVGTLDVQEFDFETAAVTGAKCFGPCVAVKQPTSTTKFYIEVYSAGNTEFFSYAADYGDPGEPDNDKEGTAIDLHLNTTVLGGFETLDDEDFYVVYQQSYVSIEQTGTGENKGLIMTVEIKEGNGPYVELTDPNDWQNIELLTGDFIRVSTAGGYAGSFDASSYRIITD